MKLISPPQSLPIELDDAKVHLRVDHSDEDFLISDLIGAATDWAENFTGRALVDQTWDQYLSEFPDSDGVIVLKKPPLIEVVGVFYTSTTEQEFADFSVDYSNTGPSSIYLTSSGSWPSPDIQRNAGRIRFRAGYIDSGNSPSAEIPPAIKSAMLMYLQVLYERGAMDPDKQKATLEVAHLLLRQYRVETAIG